MEGRRPPSTRRISQPRPDTCTSKQQQRPQALSETTAWIHNQATLPRSTSPQVSRTISVPSAGLPHHTSLVPGGVLQARKPSQLSPSKAEDKRVSAISSEDARTSNRDSQYSTASTNASGKSKPKKAVGPWRLGATIGKGATGRVRKARHQYTGQDAAIKIISKKSAEMFKSASIMKLDMLGSKPAKPGGRKLIPFGIERECVIMKLIDHPNIISLYDMWENRGELYLVLEYVEGGELFHRISTNGALPEYEAVRLFRQIIAALSYCHSFHICHRDLKPENILLDQQGNVKLADFGMAALQPAHQWLQTSCGSPHYACPEIIKGLPYRGDLADVWSAGVILYAMLCGYLPFQSDLEDPDENMHEVCHIVTEGDYSFPPNLFSEAAQDLIVSCLQPDASKRIRTRDIWHAPLMKKYENLDPLDAQGREYIGPAPSLSNQECGPALKYKSQIDPEILRNVRNLWHSVSETELTNRLMSAEPNHERVMYAKLQLFQDRLLENYQAPQIDYSSSDYHHAAAPPLMKSFSRASMPPIGLSQQHGSRFSLLTPGVYQPKRIRSHSAHARHTSNAVTEATEESYDPFRPSRARIAQTKSIDRMKITVLRNTSRASSRPPSSRLASRGSARHPTISELQSEDDDDDTLLSPATHTPAQDRFQRMASNQRRISKGPSKISILSQRSANSNSSSFVFRKASSYRRNVTFPYQQLRRMNGHKRLRSIEPSNSYLTLYQRYVQGGLQKRGTVHSQATSHGHERSNDSQRQAPNIPLPDSPVLKSPRKRPRLASLPVKRPMSQHISQDTRKVSHELARLCDETWNRASIASTAPTTAIQGGNFRNSQQSYHTRATSISMHDPVGNSLPPSRGSHVPTGPKREIEVKPLPPPASEKLIDSSELPSGTRQHLTKTRDALVARSRDSYMPEGALDDIINHFDRILQPSNVRMVDDKRRAASTPDPAIPRKDTFEQIMADAHATYRTTSEPMSKTYLPKKSSTIRLVDESEDEYKALAPIQPLTIRKQSSSSAPSSGSKTPTQQSFPLPLGLPDHESFYYDHAADNEGLNAIEEASDKENFDPVGRKAQTGQHKKRHWFRRHHVPQQSKEIESGPPMPPPQDHNPVSHQTQVTGDMHAHKKGRSISRPPLSTKRSFLQLFKSKKDKAAGGSGDYDIDDSASQSTERSSTHRPSFHTQRNASGSTTLVHPKPSRPTVRTPQPTNWLARFFRTKPATLILCFQVSKPRVRKEILKAFRAWERYGMRDISITKPSDGNPTTIRARVDAENALHIPPMKLMAELHEVLFKGRRARLSIAKLVQEKGAKGSFERVGRALEDVLREKAVLVEDKALVGEMRRGAGF